MNSQAMMAAGLGAVAGVVAGVILTKKERRAESVGFGALGLLAGLVIGMSASPIVGAAVAAGFSLVGTFLSAWKEKASAAAGVPLKVWLPAFAGLATVGLIVGVTIRTNDWLNLRGGSLRERYSEMGFSSNQVAQLMDRAAQGLDAREAVASLSSPGGAGGSSGSSALLSGGKSFLWAELKKMNLPDPELIQLLKTTGSAEVRQLLRGLERLGSTDRDQVEWLRTYYLALERSREAP